MKKKGEDFSHARKYAPPCLSEPICPKGEYQVSNYETDIIVHLQENVKVGQQVNGKGYTCDQGDLERKGSAQLFCNDKKMLQYAGIRMGGGAVEICEPLCLDYSGNFSKAFPQETKIYEWNFMGKGPSKTGVSMETCREHCKEKDYKYFARSEKMKCRCGNDPTKVSKDTGCKCDDHEYVGYNKACAYPV